MEEDKKYHGGHGPFGYNREFIGMHNTFLCPKAGSQITQASCGTRYNRALEFKARGNSHFAECLGCQIGERNVIFVRDMDVDLDVKCDCCERTMYLYRIKGMGIHGLYCKDCKELIVDCCEHGRDFTVPVKEEISAHVNSHPYRRPADPDFSWLKVDWKNMEQADLFTEADPYAPLYVDSDCVLLGVE